MTTQATANYNAAQADLARIKLTGDRPAIRQAKARVVICQAEATRARSSDPSANMAKTIEALRRANADLKRDNAYLKCEVEQLQTLVDIAYRRSKTLDS